MYFFLDFFGAQHVYLTITTIISVKSSVPTIATHAIASTFNSLGSSVVGISEGFSGLLLVPMEVLDIVDSVEVLDLVEVLVSVEVLDSVVVLDFVEVLVVLDVVSKKSRYFLINF